MGEYLKRLADDKVSNLVLGAGALLGVLVNEGVMKPRL